MISRKLVRVLLDQYALPQQGTHGVSHWARVIENGLLLAQRTGAVIEVVHLFSVFHDSQRINEGSDPGHGLRGAELALELRGSLFDIPDHSFDLLYTACAYHTHGLTDGDVTVQTCWDADRLDLGRVGIRPDPGLLCTNVARDSEVIAYAYERGLAGVVPDFVRSKWEITEIADST